MKLNQSFLVILAACVGLSQCFGAGMNQLMRQSHQASGITPLSFTGGLGGGLSGMSGMSGLSGLGGLGGYGTSNYGGSNLNQLPSATIGSGMNARNYKNFYSHAYDENGYAKQLSMSPGALQSLASMAGGMGGMGGMGGLAGLLSGRRRR